MPFTDFTRPQWGGAASDIDIHIEEHLGFVDASFEATSKLKNLTNMRNLRGSNTTRIDRVGSATVQGRKAGEALGVTPIRNDKINFVVDTVLYTRHEFDKFDEWTSSLDMRREAGREDGIALAKMFDNAAITQLQKSSDFVKPAHLGDAFHDGILHSVTGTTATEAGRKALANELVRSHRKGCEDLETRDLGDQLYSEGITIVTPQIFSLLLEHDKLMSVEYDSNGGGNSFSRARIGYVNGVKIMTSARFASAAVTDHPLGTDFNLTADQAKRKMTMFIPSLALVAAQVHTLTAEYWEDKRAFSHVLDTFQSYNIGQRRPDAVANVAVTITA